MTAQTDYQLITEDQFLKAYDDFIRMKFKGKCFWDPVYGTYVSVHQDGIILPQRTAQEAIKELEEQP